MWTFSWWHGPTIFFLSWGANSAYKEILYFIFFTIINLIRLVVQVWVETWHNQQNENASSEDSDQPGNLPSVIGLHSVLNGYLSSSGQQRLRSLWVDANLPRLIWVFAGCTAIYEISCIYLSTQGFFFQFWEGTLGPFRLGKLAW